MIINKERLTSQKKAILDYLKSIKSHPSAQAIFKRVKRKLPRISLGTVYRILKNLKEKDEIFEIPAEVARYDANLSPHAHFICQKCKEIFDISDICSQCNILKKKKIKIGKIIKHQIYFYGICKKCKRGRKIKKH